MKHLLTILILMVFLVGCSEQTIIIPKMSTSSFEKLMSEVNSIDTKYDVVDGKALPQQYESIISDYESMKGKIDSMDNSKDVSAAALIVEFKLNLFRSRNAMTYSSFQITDDICDKKSEFNNAYQNATEAINDGKAAISSIDNLIKNYPDYFKKIDSESTLKIRTELESDTSRLDSSIKSMKAYFDSVCK